MWKQTQDLPRGKVLSSNFLLHVYRTVDVMTKFSTGTALTLKPAINELHSVWYKIGVQLEVLIPDLKSTSQDSLDLLCDTIYCWMRTTPSPFRRHLVDALKAPGVDESRLGEEIEKKYCALVEQSSCDESEVQFKPKVTKDENYYSLEMSTLG